MRRPVSTPDDEKVLLEGVVARGVVGDAVLPAAPDDAGPGASDGSDRAWVVVSAAASGGVSVLGPGVPVAGCVGEGRGGVAEAVVAAAAEAGDAAAAGDIEHPDAGGQVGKAGDVPVEGGGVGTPDQFAEQTRPDPPLDLLGCAELPDAGGGDAGCRRGRRHRR